LKNKEKQMAIDTQTVKRIAFLSRLKIEDDKISATEDEFNKILQWVDQLSEVNTDAVEPLISVNENNLTLRADEVTEGNQAEEVLANAPMKEYGYFAVPKVVE
jgi:aspartyl-tRNA(Asn)/glutamyl-tRNA(Gln) amidotransferase subunit C